MDNSHDEKWKKWFASEEGKQSIEKIVKEQQEEEGEAKKLEERSTLTYPDGQKVQRGDLFIDVEAKAQYEADASNEPYGYLRYVYRINEDESVDVCLDANFALKMNDTLFDFNQAKLVERNAKLYSPLDELRPSNE